MSAALSHIIADSGTRHAAKRTNAYSTFTIPKRDGGIRTIHAPNEKLKAALRHAYEILLEGGYFRFCPEDTGFRPSHGIHSALKQLGTPKTLIQMDLAKAFHQIDHADIKAWAKTKGANSATATWLANANTARIDGKRLLVMGSPMSPAILTDMTHELRVKTIQLAKAYGGKAIWYADNYVANVPHKNAKAFTEHLEKLVQAQRWLIKDNPNICPIVLGWVYRGKLEDTKENPKAQVGWKLSRQRQRRARARIFTATIRALKARTQQTYEKYIHRISGIRVYTIGPAKNKRQAPTYANLSTAWYNSPVYSVHTKIGEILAEARAEARWYEQHSCAPVNLM